MIKRTAQRWEVGQVVKIGFVRDLTVLASVATPGNWLPDQYALTNAKRSAFYRFIPHHGLTRFATLAEALTIA